MGGFVRIFMRSTRLFDVAGPRVDRAKKNVPFVWGQRHSGAIRTLQTHLADPTIVQIPNPNKPYFCGLMHQIILLVQCYYKKESHSDLSLGK